jgi:branched-chain amino acid transport system permease protein
VLGLMLAFDVEGWVAYTVLGVALGSVYAIAASGLVVTYATSGVFNFAHGAVATMCALVYWQAKVSWHWPTPVATVFTVFLVAPAIGAVIEVVVMRGLRGTSEVTQLVIPVAVMLALNGASVWIWKRGTTSHNLVRWFGSEGVSVFGQQLYVHQLIGMGFAVAIAVVLYVVLHATRVGTTMRATVDDRNLLMLNGGRPDRMSMLSWAIGACLAGLAGVLISPERGQIEVLALTLIVFSAYPAAIAGRLRSVPMAFAGAIVIGILSRWWDKLSAGRWSAFANVRIALPAILLFVVLLMLPQDRLRGAVISRTRERFKVPTVPAAFAWGVVLVAVVAMLQALLVDTDLLKLNQAMGLSIMALSLVLLSGYAGQVNLALFAFAGIAAIAAWQFDVGPGGQALRESMSLFGILLAVAVCMIVGGLIALPALRLRGLYLGLATFAFAIIVDQLVIQQSNRLEPSIFGFDFEVNLFTNRTLTIPRPHWFGVDFTNERSYLMLLTVTFALIGVGLVALRRSAYGQTLIAMKDSPAACATLGLNIVRLKLSVFMLSAGIGGLGGLFWAAQIRTVDTSRFDLLLGLSLFMLAVVGGIGYVSGALIAGLIMAVISSVLPELFTNLGDDVPQMRWLFVDIIGNFNRFVGVALIGIGLGKNPSGVAQQVMDGFRPLAKRPIAAAAWVAGVVGLWALAWRDVISNWDFAIAVGASMLLVPQLIFRLAPGTFSDELATIEGEDLGRLGLDRQLTVADRERFDREIGITTPAELV